MATTKIVLNSTWQLVAATGVDFIIDNASSYNAQVTFQAAAPAVDAAYHTLQGGQGLVRMGLTGGVYARDSANSIGTAFLIVTT